MPEVKPLWSGTWSIPAISVPSTEGVKEVDKIVVTWISHERSDKMRPIIIGALLFIFGVVQILIGFAVLFFTEPDATALAYGIFLLGAIAGAAGLTSWLIGAKNAS